MYMIDLMSIISCRKATKFTLVDFGKGLPNFNINNRRYNDLAYLFCKTVIQLYYIGFILFCHPKLLFVQCVFVILVIAALVLKFLKKDLKFMKFIIKRKYQHYCRPLSIPFHSII